MPPLTTDGPHERCGDLVLAANPFVANRYHFGMLLGVDDLETDQAYHRGKMWQHTAWLHGGGTVWGLGVSVRPERREIVIAPGLAIDHAGRELAVDTELCMDIGAWYETAKPDDLDETIDEETGSRTFRVHAVLCADACQSRPVPSIADPCSGVQDDLDTAYSRTRERGRARLLAGPAAEGPIRFPRLRRLMGGGEEPPDPSPIERRVLDDVRAVREDVAALPPAERCRAAVRALAALDALERAPADGAAPFPVGDDDMCVVLADLTIHLRDGEEGLLLAGIDDPDVPGDRGTIVDNTVRPAHVDTATLLELLRCRELGAAEAGPAPQAVAGSQQVLDGTRVRFEVTRPLRPATVNPAAFAVATLHESGWAVLEVSRAQLDAEGTTVTVSFRRSTDTALGLLRLVASGAGPTPLLGADDGTPLSGLDIDGIHLTSGLDAALMTAGS